ncbi:hypothetical protein HPSH169_02860 [Helicobacter pylori Shi169]|uniref:Uncharacterized protein n=1 Tax=Helicobacter pylori Shi169 TaxID=1163741 RepID=A0A0E0WD50_HELPX|nr:hypothetical protein HPSH_04105 [Helicobacter pylori Shi470]AFH99270.1 hypothetical protein HPSH169_02860 [Helicobacter pylori Shi169]
MAGILHLQACIFSHFISFSGEFVIDMAFGKKDKIFKTRFGISVVSGISLLLGTLHTRAFIFCMVY